MDEAAGRPPAEGEDLVVAGLDLGHLLGGDLGVVQGRAQFGRRWNTVRSPTLSAIVADDLDGGGPGADDGHPLAGQVDRLLRPVEGVPRAAFEGIHALVAGEGRGRQQAHRGDDDPAGQVPPVVEVDSPGGCRLSNTMDSTVRLNCMWRRRSNLSVTCWR